jgi:hypothetical protein
MSDAKPVPTGGPLTAERIEAIRSRAGELRNIYYGISGIKRTCSCLPEGSTERDRCDVHGETPAIAHVEIVDDEGEVEGDRYDLHVGCDIEGCYILASVESGHGEDASWGTAVAIANAGRDMFDLTAEVEKLRAHPKSWLEDVVTAWSFWSQRTDHRYGCDFGAFLGERFLTDWNLREVAGVSEAFNKSSANAIVAKQRPPVKSPGMVVSLNGMLTSVRHELRGHARADALRQLEADIDSAPAEERDALAESYKIEDDYEGMESFNIGELQKHLREVRERWLAGDLSVVDEFFALYVP